MLYRQASETCLADRIGEGGLSAEALDRALRATAPALDRLRAARRDGSLALEWIQKARAGGARLSPRLLDTEAAAYAANSEFEKAAKLARQAIELSKRLGRKKETQQIVLRLQLYEKGESFVHRSSSVN